MLDAGALDPGGELRADLLCQRRRDLPAEKRGDLLGLHVQHRLADQLLIKRAEGDGGAERQIGGVFDLHQAPMIGLPEHIRYRAIQPGIPIQRRCNWSGDSVSAKAWASAQSSMCTNALSAMV